MTAFIEQARGERDDELVGRIIADFVPGLPVGSGRMSELFSQLVSTIKNLR